MELDEKLRWLEVRLNSSLHPRNEDLKNMFLNDENRLAFHEFLNNEDMKRLFVFVRPPRQLIASLIPPQDLSAKSVFFLKISSGVKLTKDNMDDELLFVDCGKEPMGHLELVTREVYLPLLCTGSLYTSGYGLNADKLMDVLHRLMSHVQTTHANTQGDITLSIPSIEVLAEAAATPSRRGAVLHVLETTVIGWIKQIKAVLKKDAILDLAMQAGEYPGPLDEVALWTTRKQKLHSINKQLDSPIPVDILRNLQDANSTYAQSFQHIRRDIAKTIADTDENLMYLGTMMCWFEQLHVCLDPRAMFRLFPPLIHTLLLVWTHSKYYHQSYNFHNLLRLISNEVVHRAEAMVGEDVLREPLQSYSKLKDSLRVCAAFRGTYLDYRDKAEVLNADNKQEHADKMVLRPQGPNTLFQTRMYGPLAYTPRYGMTNKPTVEDVEQMREEELWRDSPWPPRNAAAFHLLNSFMERCNDVLELVQTTRHFQLLSDAADIGGAGSQGLDALVKEIHHRYSEAMSDFFSQVTNVLAIDGTQAFETAFFSFRTVVKELERKLSEVLRQSFYQCPTINAQLRLLEVFEGISGRELVQLHLKDKDDALVESFTRELVDVRAMFRSQQKNCPSHYNMPPVVSKLMWIYALKQRIQGPMSKMKSVSPHSLQGDLGWHLREAYTEAIGDFERYEAKVIADWQNHFTTDLTERLKQPLLVADDFDETEEDEEERLPTVHVNLDPRLLLLLREIHYLGNEPFCLRLPPPARDLLRNTDARMLRVTATRLETIVSKYAAVMRNMTDYELPLFERHLAKIDQLFEEGLSKYTWKTEESADFIETANAIVNVELHTSLDIVQTNCQEIMDITKSWSEGVLDSFAVRNVGRSYSMQELIEIQQDLNMQFASQVIPSGNRIHALVQSSFQAVQISEASPAWQDYLEFIDDIVLNGLKQSCLTSLKSMLSHMIASNLTEEEAQESQLCRLPILTIRLELIDKQVTFRPPLDEDMSNVSIQETVRQWLGQFLSRASLVKMLASKGCYQDYIENDVDVKELTEQIVVLVKHNAEQCLTLYELFTEFAYIWQLDVTQTFEEFLTGRMSPNPYRSPSIGAASNLRRIASAKSTTSKESSSSIQTAGLIGTAERPFLTPKLSRDHNTNTPSLDSFDAEIEIYQTARDKIQKLADWQDVGWLRVDLKPIKQVLATYASKWMWTFTKYLSDRVSGMLNELDEFLRRTEPQIEGITGEERDTASFMKMMRLFNEVSAQQQEMEGKFAAMHRTVLLVKKYGQKLDDNTQALFDGAPGRWNNLKTKVSLAKQRLGPRIQVESEHITKDLAAFSNRVVAIHEELEGSDVYSRYCAIRDAWVNMNSIMKRLAILENEAQDLKELQELLEASIVNFALLPECRSNLTKLKQLWEAVRMIDEQHMQWKRHRWQKMDTKMLTEQTAQQLANISQLPEDVFHWDVYIGLHESITTIQACLPLIDDLRNPAMRTRHWKQLVRVTGGAIQIDNETLKRMTLGELLGLGLQQHTEDVQAIVQRAVKDLSIERSLKTYDEVWLSKKFELREHARNRAIALHAARNEHDENSGDGHSEISHPSENMSQHLGVGGRGHARTTSRMSNQSSLARTRKTSISSLPSSLVQTEESPLLSLLTNTSAIFSELECHQVALQTMHSSSAAGSFLDEVMKWQRQLQTIEAALTIWLDVQQKWTEMEEVYSTAEVKTALPQDAGVFAVVNRDFHLLMSATEKNPNVLQCCQRKNILVILEKMNSSLEHCRKSLLVYLERRRQKFPRFFFLAIEDVLHITCGGYDLNHVNLYISKLFENIGKIVYEEVHDSDKYTMQITAVESYLGERLALKEIPCEGTIESWLSMLSQAIKTALQTQLLAASGVDKPRPRTREIHSAGARRVEVTDGGKVIDRRSSVTSRNSIVAADKPGSRASVRRDQEESVAAILQQKQSWVLDHVTEVVHLTMQIQMTQLSQDAMQQLESGQQNALQVARDKVEATLKSSLMMLKGLEDAKELQSRQSQRKSSAGSQGQKEKERPESMAETISQIGGFASHRGSLMDINLGAFENQPTPIPEEGSICDNMSIAEVTTAEPVNTMNLGDIPIIAKKDETAKEDAEDVEAGGDDETLLILFPCQIHKIACVISVLAQQRDRLERLEKVSGAQPSSVAKSFDWQSELRYTLDKDSQDVHIQCLDSEFTYGFEYIGSAMREVITPVTEKAFVGLTQAVKSYYAGLCAGPADIGQLSTICELSRSFGQPLYTFNCSKSLGQNMLHDIFKGYALTGAWICFNNLKTLPPTILSILAQLLRTVQGSLSAGNPTVHLQAEDVQLGAAGACFATIDSTIHVTSGDLEKLLSFNSSVASLPEELLRQFRTVSILQPDLHMMFDILLTSKGFANASELARKTVLVFDMIRQLAGTNTAISDYSTYTTVESSGQRIGWSCQTLKHVAMEAVTQLDQILYRKNQNFGSKKSLDALDEPDRNQIDKTKRRASEVIDLRRDEDEAVVLALRNVFMPRLLERDAGVFMTLLADMWPDVNVPLSFGGRKSASALPSEVDAKSRNATPLNFSRDSNLRPRSFRDSLHLNTAVVSLPSVFGDHFLSHDDMKQAVIEHIDDAIALATSSVGLLPGAAFQARVSQLAQLSVVHRTIIVAGPAGCGKSECIKTFALAERERGKTITIQSIFTKALQSDELLGYAHPTTKQWKEGLLPDLLRKLCLQEPGENATHASIMKVLQLDGELDRNQFELMQCILRDGGSVVLGNNERIVLPDCLRFVWETDNLAHISPALLATIGVLSMSSEDVGWRMELAIWLDRRPSGDAARLRSLCDVYVETVLAFLDESTRPPVLRTGDAGVPHLHRSIGHTQENMVATFTVLLEALLSQFTSVTDEAIEHFFIFSCIWAFGGSLEDEARETFSCWWRQTFYSGVKFPEGGSVFDYMVDSDSKQFVLWADIAPTYSGTPNAGIPHDAFVHTVSNEQLLYLLGMLSDYGKSVMLVGENGCGKTAIVNERIRTVCSGEVAEVLELCIQTDSFTTARVLHERLVDRLEWKHARTFVPKGNKRLMCFVDDINIAQCSMPVESKLDEYQNQTALEAVRQHIDDGGIYDPDDHSWKYIKNVTYVTTVNPQTSVSVPAISGRLLRHFAVFTCPYPRKSELQTIFTTLLHSHFVLPDLTLTAATSTGRSFDEDKHVAVHAVADEDSFRSLLALIVNVTLELQDKLRVMFLPTAQRCHYVFTLRDLGVIFRNLCLSLRPGCSTDNLLLLWEHECLWVYSHRMVNEVDKTRYNQAFIRAVRKDFSNEEQIQLLLQKDKPVFSSLTEQDSGLVTAGNVLGNVNQNVSDDDMKTDFYRPVYDVNSVKALMEHGIDEYNKENPRIKLALYRSAIEQVCRLARLISSPHDLAHSVLVADGCPGRCRTIANLAAHLAGFHIVQINPSAIANSAVYDTAAFKTELVAAYSMAGVKGEKVLLLMDDDDLAEENFLVYLTEFILSGSISLLFSQEEQTTIINSIRTEVTQAGLTYTRQVAWQFFLQTVKKNFRICLIAACEKSQFQRRCRDYPSFTKNVNFIWFPHWTKAQLIEHAEYHLRGVDWLTAVQRENIAHLLASIHLSIRQHDGQEEGSGMYRHLANLTYDKYVEKFISMANARYAKIHNVHNAMQQLMSQIEMENTLARKLQKELEHEKMVLDERKAGTVKILSQIGQDTAITQQQIKIVKTQMNKIHKLKKLLPEYQVSHERSVYKTVAIVADTKKIVENIELESLSELRAMSKPAIETEDLMTAIIMILKNPQADLTWQKGAKRQMANLERFIEELISFDETVLPESTLELVEPYLRKPSFDLDVVQAKTGNSACVSLCKWVKGVCRYHRMMISRVKPLHKKVEETTQAIDDAEHKMMILDKKRKALDLRLADLAKGFEEATIDKNDQHDKTLKMEKMLETAARLRKVLKPEQKRIQNILDSLAVRENCIAGGVAMAAGFATYLGPYLYNFRRLMLTVHWPNCLRERGIPLIIDSIDEIRGRVVDWSMEATPSNSAGSDVYHIDNSDTDNWKNMNEEVDNWQGEQTASDEHIGTNEKLQQDNDTGLEQIIEEEEDGRSPRDHHMLEGESQEVDHSAPAINSQQFAIYMQSLIKLLVGPEMLNEWIKRDFGQQQLENAAIVYSSWQRPPLLIDPCGEGIAFLHHLNNDINSSKLTRISMDASPIPLGSKKRSVSQTVVTVEKLAVQGRPLLLHSTGESIDNMLMSLIHHLNTAPEDTSDEEPRMMRYCSRRILCHPSFRLYLATSMPKPHLSAANACTVTFVNYGSSNETFVDDLLSRSFALLHPALYAERRSLLRSVDANLQGLREVTQFFRQRLHANTSTRGKLFDARDVDIIADLTDKMIEMSERVRTGRLLLLQLDGVREELFPLARRATMLHAVLCSLACVRPQYRFTSAYFTRLFDDAIRPEGGGLPDEFLHANDVNDLKELRPTSSKVEVRVSASPGSDKPASNTEKTQTAETAKEGDSYKDDFEQDGSSTTNQNAIPIGTESDEAALKEEIFEMPEAGVFPSEGVEYTSLADNQIKQLVDRLTSLVYQRVQQGLFEEDRLIFSTMLCLNIQEESGYFSDEEMSLLLQGNPGLGMQLSLADFDCHADPLPIPADKWDDILAVSVLPGVLDSLCVHMASQPDAWMEWYRSDRPEMEALPVSSDGGSQAEEEGARALGATPDLGPFSDFHQLLLLRLLRPDRLPIAMATYVARHLGGILGDVGGVLDLSGMLAEARATPHRGVFVLIPPSPSSSQRHLVSNVTMKYSPVEVIKEIAEVQSVPVVVVEMGSGREAAIVDALHAAEREDHWLVIQHVHLISASFLHQLNYHLSRIASSRVDKVDMKLLVWLVGEPSDEMPIELAQHLFTLSWESLQLLVAPPVAENEGLSEQETFKLNSASLENALTTTFEWSFDTIPDELLQQLQPVKKSLVFAAIVVNAVFMARMQLGSRGVSQRYPVASSCQMQQALNELIRLTNRQADEPMDISDICQLLIQNVYSNLVCKHWDLAYISKLVEYVFTATVNEQESTLVLGSTEIPLPPANVDLKDLGRWFSEKTNQHVSTVGALSLCSNADKEANSATAGEFVRLLDEMYEAQNMDVGDIAPSPRQPPQVNVLQLRAIVDAIHERLPPLLQLGDVPSALVTADQFPYHRPSVCSELTAQSVSMPESIGFVLLQECLWLNSLLCHIRRCLHTLRQCLLSGPEAFGRRLHELARDLLTQRVPVSWLHPNCQPSTHSLHSWLDDLKKRYMQMLKWMKKKMVPIFKAGQSQVESYGRLESIWLGGLVNPQALFTALKHEKAIVSKCLVDQVVMKCEVSRRSSDTENADETGAIVIEDVYMQGATWDVEQNCLTVSSDDLTKLPVIHVTPVLKNADEEEDGIEVFDCPVFMTKARQVCAFTLPLSIGEDEPKDTWILAGAAIILDPGIPEDWPRNPRAFLVPKSSRTLETQQSSNIASDTTSQRSENAERQVLQQADTQEAYTSRSDLSQRSQLSYKRMTPKAAPLPLGLQMQKEKPILQSDEEDKRTSVSRTSSRSKPSEHCEKKTNEDVQSFRDSEQEATEDKADSDKSVKSAEDMTSEQELDMYHGSQQSIVSAAARSKRGSQQSVTSRARSQQSHDSAKSKLSASRHSEEEYRGTPSEVRQSPPPQEHVEPSSPEHLETSASEEQVENHGEQSAQSMSSIRSRHGQMEGEEEEEDEEQEQEEEEEDEAHPTSSVRASVSSNLGGHQAEETLQDVTRKPSEERESRVGSVAPSEHSSVFEPTAEPESRGQEPPVNRSVDELHRRRSERSASQDSIAESLKGSVRQPSRQSRKSNQSQAAVADGEEVNQQERKDSSTFA